MAALTPMMKQYLEIKEQNEDCILFFRLGDFYEMFAEDARLAAKELDLTLTTRDRSVDDPDERTPMCGVPYHSSEAYIARLIAKGYKVAICEQTEDPALAKGLVRREVVRIITPGTVIDTAMLDEGRNNYICSIYMDEMGGGVCFCDISTGEVYATGAFGEDAVERIINELGRFSPAEAVLNIKTEDDGQAARALSGQISCRREAGSDADFEYEAASGRVLSQFCVSDLDQLGLAAAVPVVKAVGGLLGYLHTTQKTDLSHINRLDYYVSGQFMELDPAARRNLELTETIRSKEKRGSLLWVLDKTNTSMGGRLIRGWLEKPLLNTVAIRRRNTAVSELVKNNVQRQELAAHLKEISDIERLIGRIVYGTANCRDFVALSQSAVVVPKLKRILSGMGSNYLKELYGDLDELVDIKSLVERAIIDNPPFSVREGGFIKDGYDEDVDRLREIMSGGKGGVASIEAQEKERTGIKGLKIGYNRVFGYYIEVTKSYMSQVPDDYIRKQTLANCERYITQDLKELEKTILTAQERIVELEYELFSQIRQTIADQVHRIQKTAQAIAQTDVLCSFAQVAAKNNYCMPEVDNSQAIEIRDGRHPVVEQVLTDGLFVPNDTFIDTATSWVEIITGPNMAGKSTYMRQVALIVLMAQMGSFVPAKSARIGIVDRVFTRIGASDDLSSGQSTFMVEMTEVAEILKYSTGRSLLILDEIGRGTSTFDGMSIARAVLEYVADKNKSGAKTLFATHYHELTELEDLLDGVKNYSVAVKKRGDEIIFLRKIVRGGADDSYGIEVAKLAGLPDKVIRRAKEVLKALESGSTVDEGKNRGVQKEREQISLMDMSAGQVAQKLRDLDVNTLTPIEAMNVLYELKKLAQQPD